MLAHFLFDLDSQFSHLALSFLLDPPHLLNHFREVDFPYHPVVFLELFADLAHSLLQRSNECSQSCNLLLALLNEPLLLFELFHLLCLVLLEVGV